MAVLYLIPTVLSENPAEEVLPAYVSETIASLRYFIVENVRTSRRFISSLNLGITIDELTFFELNKHTPPEAVPGFISPLKEGNNVGLISEAGMPGIADPGSEIVRLAHQQQIPVKPLTGPSSIFLALAASGMNGQNFAFTGYLPIQKKDRMQAIRKLEKRSSDEHQTQVFMEAPYRNTSLIQDILKACNPQSQLCIAANITSASEFIQTKTIREWSKGKLPELHKIPCIFILQAS